MAGEGDSKRRRGRPERPDFALVEQVARGFMEKPWNKTPHEAVRIAVDIVNSYGDIGIDEPPPLLRSQIKLIRSATATGDGSLLAADNPRVQAAIKRWEKTCKGADDPTPWPATTLDARDTVVEQIAAKLRRRLRKETEAKG